MASTVRLLHVPDRPVGTDWHNQQAKMPPNKQEPRILSLCIIRDRKRSAFHMYSEAPDGRDRRELAVTNQTVRNTPLTCRWFKSGARNHLPANRSLEFRFEIRV